MRAWLALWLAAACAGEQKHSFPEGLAPLEDNTASLPSGRDDEPYPEELSVVSGEEDSYAWAHARGYVHAPVAQTWEALLDPDVIVDRRAVDDWEVTWDVEEGYDASYRIHHVVYAFVTVEWDADYRHGAVEGTVDDPETVWIRWQIVGGSEYIDVLEGSIVLETVDDGISEIQMIEHLGAVQTGPEDITSYFEDLYASVLARVAGEELPTYE